jgi:hypothetical protein
MIERTDSPWRVTPKGPQDHKQKMIRIWRTKAEELREIAMGMKDVCSRGGMLNAADNYDHLADEAEQAGPKPPRSFAEWMDATLS